MANTPDRKICDTILDAIGHTPMVRVHAITRGQIEADVLIKLETFNPGNSIKDRMAVRMIEDAELAESIVGRHRNRGETLIRFRRW